MLAASAVRVVQDRRMRCHKAQNKSAARVERSRIRDRRKRQRKGKEKKEKVEEGETEGGTGMRCVAEVP